MTAHSVVIPAELLEKIDAAITENKQLGCETREQFIEDAITALLQTLSGRREKENSSKKA